MKRSLLFLSLLSVLAFACGGISPPEEDCDGQPKQTGLPRFARLMHDPQWMPWPSRMADPDWPSGYSSEWLSNPLGPAQGSDNMLKGCSWFFNPAYCRGALRASVDPNTRFDYLGFRCADSLEG